MLGRGGEAAPRLRDGVYEESAWKASRTQAVDKEEEACTQRGRDAKGLSGLRNRLMSPDVNEQQQELGKKRAEREGPGAPGESVWIYPAEVGSQQRVFTMGMKHTDGVLRRSLGPRGGSGLIPIVSGFHPDSRGMPSSFPPHR